ncbi:MAG: VOC family protein [Rhizobiaceae bacterium]
MANTQNTPEGYCSVTPYFTVENADHLMEFLKTVFGASVVKENRYPDNRIQHARMLVGDSIIMMNESSETYPVNVSQMHLFVDDCDSIYDAALRSGAISLMEPNDRPHGDRMAGIKDPCGNIWWIATHRQPP